jgi:hypothetical protein
MPELTTTALVKTYVGLSGSGEDAIIDAMVAAAEQMIWTACNRPLGFTKGTQTDELDGERSTGLVLTYTPVDSAASFTIDVRGEGSTSYRVSSDTYRVDYANGVVKFRNSITGRWLSGLDVLPSQELSGLPLPSQNFGGEYRNVLVSYTGGYTAGSMPPELTTAALELAVAMYEFRRTNRGNSAVQSESLGDYSYTNKALPDGASPIAIAFRNIKETYLGRFIRNGVLS